MVAALVVILGIFVAVTVHEFSHFIAAKSFGMKATEAFFGFGPTLWSTQRGETEYGFKALPLGGYVRITGMNPAEEVDPAEEHRTYRGRPFWQKSVVVLAGVLSNFALALVLIYGIFVAVGLPEPSEAPVLGSISEEINGRPSPALAAGLEEGDRILVLDGMEVATWDEVREYVSARPDTAIEVVLDRGGTEITTTVTPALFENEDGTTRGLVGVTVDFVNVRLGPLEAVPESVDVFADVLTGTAEGVGRLLWPPNLLSAIDSAVEGGVEPEDRPIGPVGLVRNADEFRSALGWDGLLFIIASFNIIIALFNVLPLYPLDGGHFAVALYEKLRGRRVDVEKLLPVAAVVLFFVISIFLIGLWFDLFGGPLELG